MGIDIQVTDRLELNSSALITADNYGEGQGNNITIKAGSVKLNGQNKEVYNYYRNEETEKEAFRDSLNRIATNNFETGTGGTIQITTSTLEATEGYLEASTKSLGKAGNLFINANDSVTLDHYASISASAVPQEENSPTGEAGTITLTTRNLTLRRNSYINGLNTGTGPAGSITITTENTLIDGTNDENLHGETGIYTEANNAGGGNINLLVHDRLEVVNSKITAKSKGTRPQDKGGNLTIRSPQIFTLDNSQLLANAYAGNGGNIILETPQFDVRGDQWEINVSSELGWNGQFALNNTKLSELVNMERPPLQELPLLTNRCASFSKDNLSRFIITARDILPRSPEDLRTHTIDDRGF